MTILMKVPSFSYAQRVSFVGGEGVIQDFKRKAGKWIYIVEMPLGVEPSFGRVGAETTVVLDETDLWAA